MAIVTNYGDAFAATAAFPIRLSVASIDSEFIREKSVDGSPAAILIDKQTIIGDGDIRRGDIDFCRFGFVVF
jgi:hypothetical protein